jgi:hypothetical protein
MSLPAREPAASAPEAQTAPPAAAPRSAGLPASVLALQRAAGNRATVAMIQRMAPCPATLRASDPTPPGWKPYFGASSVFHCGFRGILEDRKPTPTDPMNECFYDDSGTLVDASHPYAACGGTPDYYDSKSDPVKHFAIDKGGIVRAGPGAFYESRKHDIDKSIVEPVARWFEQGLRGIYGYPGM